MSYTNRQELEYLEASLESLKKKFESEVTPMDVIAGILYFFGETEFSTNYERLNNAFYKEKENQFLKEFRFREGGPYPYSELLDNVFSRLSVSGLLGCQNPDYRQFTMNENQIKRIEKGPLKKFSSGQIIELKSLSRRIKENLR